MNDLEIEEEEKPEELIFAEHLVVENKYAEALQVLMEFGEKKKLPLNHKVSCLILQARISMWIGKHEYSIKIIKQAYEESLSLGENFQTFFALTFLALLYNFQGMFDKARETIIKSEKLFQTFTKESSAEYTHSEAMLFFINGFLTSQDDVDRGLEYLKYSLSLWDKIEPQLEKAMTYLCIGLTLHSSKGELDQSINYLKQGLDIAEEINSKFGIAVLHTNLGIVYQFKGELNISLKHYEISLNLFKEINNRQRVAALYNMIGELLNNKGEVEQALRNIEKSLAIRKEIGSPFYLISSLVSATEISLETGDMDKVNKYFHAVKKLSEQIKHPGIERWIAFIEAMKLKRSQRIRDKAKVEELLKKILEKSDTQFELTIKTLIHLCDLFLTELHTTNNLEVLDEINPLINRLLEIAKISHSYWILCETYILQARVAIITLDLNEARRLLTQAQLLAEKYGLNQLAIKISNEHDELLKQLKVWESLRESKAPVKERIELARLNDQMANMLQKRVTEPDEIKDEESVVILIISTGGTPIFSQSFAEGWSFQDHLFGGFLSAINSFSGEMFSQGLDRAIFGEYTILINSVSPFIICYLFKGQSFLAQQRMKQFIDTIQTDKKIWETIKKYYEAHRLIQETDLPSLDILVNKVFIERTFKFN